MEEETRAAILVKAFDFFSVSIAESHARNTKKCGKLSEFNVNPFTVHYLAAFAFGDVSPRSLAKALIYPRVLGTSIATTFGNNVQTFCHEVLGGFASTTAGMDIEFIDAVDHRKKYCQLKAGPQTINNDDVTTIVNHFLKLRNLARTNHLGEFNLSTDCCVGILYGDHSQISANYKKIEEVYDVFSGAEFWHRLTGDEDFYNDLIRVFVSCANDYMETNLLEETISQLEDDIKQNPGILAAGAGRPDFDIVEFPTN